MSIKNEIENIVKFIPDLIEDDTFDYINDVIESYDNCQKEDKILENLYFKEFCQILETVKQQLTEKGIDYNAVMGERVINDLFN